MGWPKGRPQSEEHVQRRMESRRRGPNPKSRCADCGKEISYGSTYCLKCMHIGERNPRWKGGQGLSDGYMYVLKPGHPYATDQGYVLRSHLVMEEILGRFLVPPEMVHHEGARDDDRSEMLILFPSNKEHLGYHAALRRV